jgi:uncharacterized protein (TIGR00661 family)
MIFNSFKHKKTSVFFKKNIDKTMPEKTQQTVLFCPLDWGLGHISRDLPLIREFAKHGHRVVVAASDIICQWIQNEAPSIETTPFDGPDIKYSEKGFSFGKMALQLPRLLFWPAKEKNRIKELVDIYQPHLIISDNRYGARHQKVFSVIITHQLYIKLPRRLKWAEYPLHLLVKYLIRQFDECWIPDLPGSQSLAGDLVHKYALPENALLIGPLSRFDSFQSAADSIPPENSVLTIISGPEPQRSILENLLKKALTQHHGKKTLITGKIEPNEEKNNTKLTTIPHQSTPEMIKQIRCHNLIISRSGYSTIMDMYYLKRNIVIIPTPGQTEQEYLGDYHNRKGHIKIEQHKAEDIDFDFISTQLKQAYHEEPSINFRTILNPYMENPAQKKPLTCNKI